jgi:hypothetical protein
VTVFEHPRCGDDHRLPGAGRGLPCGQRRGADPAQGPTSWNSCSRLGLGCRHVSRSPNRSDVGSCADAGYYALVPPLSVGEHTIRIQGTLDTFMVDVTYHITVAPRR